MSQRVTRSSSALAEMKKGKSKSKVETIKTTNLPKSTKKSAQKLSEPAIETAETIYDFTVNDINGDAVSLDKYKGHVCIVVNVASKCGHTKINYEQFVELHKKYADKKGLRILAFPCNQFGGQEPGTADAICKFVAKYDVDFDVFEKINVNGPNAHPLYQFLSSKLPDPKGKGDKIKWNFTKFIIDDEGKPVERFTPATKPLTLVEILEKYW